jgi:Na+-translocating ferredoxin:NAD+ oxidoreductase RnfC subunit
MNLLEKIKAAGIVGTGGAGFPSALKLDCNVEYLLVNAAECEPLLQTDKFIMKNFAGQTVEAIDAVAAQTGAKKVFIGIKGINTACIAAMNAAIAQKGSAAKVFELDNYYPAGDEQMLVYDITGRVVPPASIPLKVGAVVCNIGTMLAIYDAMHDIPHTQKYLTITGLVKSPAVLHVPVGISFAECITAAGGASIAEYKIISGGPMMGKVLRKEDAEKTPVTKTTSGIIVVSADSNFVARLNDLKVQQILNRAKSACIQCSFCTELCPRALTGHKLRPHRVMRKMSAQDFSQNLVADDVLREALICCGCGICETFACPMGLSPRQVNLYVKAQLKGEKPDIPAGDFVVSPQRPYRKIAPAKIMARMGLLPLYDHAEYKCIELNTRKARIPCSQHIGAPAEPVVAAGDNVKCGQLIARAVEGKPGANVHASIDGRVSAAGQCIEIEGA